MAVLWSDLLVPDGELEEGWFPDDECWIWSGSYIRQYPIIPVRNENGRGTSVNPARVSYELHYGPISKRGNFRRSCGNPACVRPDHLVLKWSAA